MDPNVLNCFHSMPVACVKSEPFTADPNLSGESLKPWYRWLERQIGFYPLFLAFGTPLAIENTFYSHDSYECIPKERQSRNVLAIFNLHAVRNCVFTDYDVWAHSDADAFEAIETGEEPDADWQRALFKPLWSRMQWFQKARRDPTSVQLLARRLDLRRAHEIWTQDEETLYEVQSRGLMNAKVRHLENPVGWDEELFPV